MSAIDDGDCPAGWARASLDQVCLSVADGDHQPPPQVERGVPFLVIGNVRDGRIDFSEARFVPESYFRSLAEQRKPSRGDVLYSVTGSFGIPVLVTTDQSFCVQRHIAILKPAAKMSSGYLARALGTTAAFRQASDAATGTAQKTVGLKQLRKFTVPIAPLREQHRIVEAIESYFTRLDDAVATLERAQRNLKRYRASVLKAAVEGRLVPTEAELARAEGRDYEPASMLLERILAERRRRWQKAGGRSNYQKPVVPDTTDLPELPEGWCWTTVDAVGDVLLGRRRAPDYRGQLRPYLRVANVRDDRVDLDQIKRMPFDKLHAEHYLLHPGDILVSEGQSPERIGQSAIYKGDIDGLCFQSTLHRFRPFIAGPTSEFAQLVFRSHVRSGVFQRYASITTNIAHLVLNRFKAVPFPLPPRPEQGRIVRAAEELLSLGEAVDDTSNREIARCRRLRQSILKWAFEGKLADQDPSDEPASALLERIRSQAMASRLSAGDTGDRRRRRGDRRTPVQAENKP